MLKDCKHGFRREDCMATSMTSTAGFSDPQLADNGHKEGHTFANEVSLVFFHYL